MGWVAFVPHPNRASSRPKRAARSGETPALVLGPPPNLSSAVKFARCTFSCMKKLILIWLLVAGCAYARAQGPARLACVPVIRKSRKHAGSLPPRQTLLQPLKKDLSSYAQSMRNGFYAFHTADRDTTLLDSLPSNGQQLQDFYQSTDCADDLQKPVTHMPALSTASFRAYFIDAFRVRGGPAPGVHAAVCPDAHAIQFHTGGQRRSVGTNLHPRRVRLSTPKDRVPDSITTGKGKPKIHPTQI